MEKVPAFSEVLLVSWILEHTIRHDIHDPFRDAGERLPTHHFKNAPGSAITTGR